MVESVKELSKVFLYDLMTEWWPLQLVAICYSSCYTKEEITSEEDHFLLRTDIKTYKKVIAVTWYFLLTVILAVLIDVYNFKSDAKCIVSGPIIDKYSNDNNITFSTVNETMTLMFRKYNSGSLISLYPINVYSKFIQPNDHKLAFTAGCYGGCNILNASTAGHDDRPFCSNTTFALQNTIYCVNPNAPECEGGFGKYTDFFAHPSWRVLITLIIPLLLRFTISRIGDILVSRTCSSDTFLKFHIQLSSYQTVSMIFFTLISLLCTYISLKIYTVLTMIGVEAFKQDVIAVISCFFSLTLLTPVFTPIASLITFTIKVIKLKLGFDVSLDTQLIQEIKATDVIVVIVVPAVFLIVLIVFVIASLIGFIDYYWVIVFGMVIFFQMFFLGQMYLSLALNFKLKDAEECDLAFSSQISCLYLLIFILSFLAGVAYSVMLYSDFY
ncbi:hypothetical protein ABK040_007577 [Willaertia magna]